MKKKWTIVAFSICITIVVGLIATIIVLASGTQGVGTSVSVLYVATDIEGTVSAKYSKVNKNTSAVISTTDMVTSSGSKTVSFLSTAPTTTNLLNPTESNIALTAEQDLIITYTFTAVATYYATLEYKDSSTSASNIEFSYALNDGAYSDEMSMPIEVTPDHSTTYSIRLHIANTARNANLSGSLNWALTKDGGNTPNGGDNIDTVSISYANNEGSVVNSDTVTFKKNADGTKFKIVGPTPIIDSTSTTSYLNGSFSDRTTTATGKVSSIDDLTNSNGAEFYYFCTNSAVVGSLSYNDPETIYYTSTADSTLESWYDLPDTNTNLYACFMTPNCENGYESGITQVILSNDKRYLSENDDFSGNEITDIVIPQSVNEIGTVYDGYGVFNRTNITNIIVPGSVYYIGPNAFGSCYSLTNVILMDGVEALDYGSFSMCTSLIKIDLPESITKIGGGVFEYCEALTDINIPDSLESVGTAIFKGCSNLSYSIYDDVEYYGNKTNPYVMAYGLNAKTKTSLSIKEGTKIICSSVFASYSGLTDVIIPDSVKNIGASAFSKCSDLTNVTLGAGVKVIESSAFSGCNGLTSITIPNSVTEIKDSAFSGCSGLTSITIPDSVTSIGSKVFEKCSGLESITVSSNNSVYYSSNNCIIKKSNNLLVLGCKTSIIPNNVTAIVGSAFAGCSGLTNITIPDSVTDIEDKAFSGCSDLTSVTIGAGVTRIWSYTFEECSSLMSITISSNNSVYYSSNNCIIKKSDNSLILGCKSSIIPESVTSISDRAFIYCTSLTSITIPDNVTSIGDYAFYMSGLTSITIGSGVTSIGDSVFFYCSSLTSVTIGSGMTNIGFRTFEGCSKLTNVTFADTSKTWTIKYRSTVEASDVSVADPTQNATYLTSTYLMYTWTKNS